MENQKVRKLVLSALMAALVYVATSIIQIPSPVNGYVNLGDCFVLLSGWLLGPWYGAAAAGIGSMLVDLLSGYGHYVPGTLIIKGLDALVAALIFRALGRGKTAMLVSGIVGETIMVLGYFAYASMILGKGLAAAASIPGNIVQGIAGIAIGLALAVLLQKAKAPALSGLELRKILTRRLVRKTKGRLIYGRNYGTYIGESAAFGTGRAGVRRCGPPTGGDCPSAEGTARGHRMQYQ